MSFTYFAEGFDAVIRNFDSLDTIPKLVFIAYLMSGLIVPFYNYKLAGKFRTGQNGVGDLCIRSLVLAACWRIPALLYSMMCFPFLAVPMFISTFMDIATRIMVIMAAKKAMDIHKKKAIDKLVGECSDVAAETESDTRTEIVVQNR